MTLRGYFIDVREIILLDGRFGMIVVAGVKRIL